LHYFFSCKFWHDLFFSCKFWSVYFFFVIFDVIFLFLQILTWFISLCQISDQIWYYKSLFCFLLCFLLKILFIYTCKFHLILQFMQCMNRMTIGRNLPQSVRFQLSENLLKVLINQFDVSDMTNEISQSNFWQNLRITSFCVVCFSSLLYDFTSALSTQASDQDVAKQNYNIVTWISNLKILRECWLFSIRSLWQE